MLQAEAQKANLQGQTIVSAVGDAGATDCEASNATIAVRGISVDAPAVLQEVTGVGGTTFTGDDNHNPSFWNASNDPLTGGSAIKYIPETTWNDGFGSSTGGGVSTIVAKPAYQSALTPADGHRDVPDVALSASPAHDPYLLCDVNHSDATHGGACTDGFRDASTTLVFAAGGTSFGAPEFAGILALINQATENAAGSGNVNPTLYTLAATPGANAFHDITTGNNKQLCQGGSTGCTSANSHNQVAETRSGLPAYAGLFLIPLGAVILSAGRRRWAAFLGMLLMVAAFSVQIACGGGSSNNNNNNNNPPPNLSIGWSAGTGYDVVTGLGSVDVSNLANAWPGFTSAPAFKLDQSLVTAPTTSVPGVFTITLTRTNSGATGTVTLSCIGTGDASGDAPISCSRNPTQLTLSGTPTSSTLTVTATHAGTYSVLVTGQSGAVSHSVNVPVTVN